MQSPQYFSIPKYDIFNAKLSPLTSVGSSEQIEQRISIEDSLEIPSDTQQWNKYNNRFYIQGMDSQQHIQTKQQLFQQIEEQIMTYFKNKGVDAGNPGDFKKQFNKILHKRVSMMAEVSQKVTLKANAGSSLLERRLQKKMTLTL